jgi:hypothetical protein
MDTCPLCGLSYDWRCRCLKGHMKCKNGHEWYLCLAHDKNMVVVGPADHSTSTYECTCEGKPLPDYHNLLREAAWVVLMYDQCNTNHVVEHLGSRGKLLHETVDDLRKLFSGNQLPGQNDLVNELTKDGTFREGYTNPTVPKKFQDLQPRTTTRDKIRNG